jgi:DNA-binding transcriptional ArsR family regulator
MEDEDAFEEGEAFGGDYKILIKKLIDPRARTMYSILELLLQNVKSEPVSASNIKDKLGISKQAASNAARRLEETGFITRTPEGYMVNQGFIINLLIQLVGEILKKLEL